MSFNYLNGPRAKVNVLFKMSCFSIKMSSRTVKYISNDLLYFFVTVTFIYKHIKSAGLKM